MGVIITGLPYSCIKGIFKYLLVYNAFESKKNGIPNS